jgi:hypothetical protein
MKRRLPSKCFRKLAQVPSGATTGAVQVKYRGTLSSHVPFIAFIVLPSSQVSRIGDTMSEQRGCDQRHRGSHYLWALGPFVLALRSKAATVFCDLLTLPTRKFADFGR